MNDGKQKEQKTDPLGENQLGKSGKALEKQHLFISQRAVRASGTSVNSEPGSSLKMGSSKPQRQVAWEPYGRITFSNQKSTVSWVTLRL